MAQKSKIVDASARYQDIGQAKQIMDIVQANIHFCTKTIKNIQDFISSGSR